jgi:hypothetical protein
MDDKQFTKLFNKRIKKLRKQQMMYVNALTELSVFCKNYQDNIHDEQISTREQFDILRDVILEMTRRYYD